MWWLLAALVLFGFGTYSFYTGKPTTSQPQQLRGLFPGTRVMHDDGSFARFGGWFRGALVPGLAVFALCGVIGTLGHGNPGGTGHHWGNTAFAVGAVTMLLFWVVGALRNPLFGMPQWLAAELARRQSGDKSGLPGVAAGSLADQAYRLVVAHGTATVSELGSALGVSYNEVAKALGKVIGDMVLEGSWSGGPPIALVRGTSGPDTRISVVDKPRMYV
jgi:hypothetical protein